MNSWKSHRFILKDESVAEYFNIHWTVFAPNSALLMKMLAVPCVCENSNSDGNISIKNELL